MQGKKEEKEGNRPKKKSALRMNLRDLFFLVPRRYLHPAHIDENSL